MAFKLSSADDTMRTEICKEAKTILVKENPDLVFTLELRYDALQTAVRRNHEFRDYEIRAVSGQHQNAMLKMLDAYLQSDAVDSSIREQMTLEDAKGNVHKRARTEPPSTQMVAELSQDAEELEAKVEELESELAKIAENYEAKRKEVNEAIKEAKTALKTAEEVAHAKKVAELSALPAPFASAPPPPAPMAPPKTEAFDDFVESLQKEQVKLLRSVGAITQDLSAVGVPHLFTEDELGNFSIKEQKALFKHGFAARPFTATG